MPVDRRHAERPYRIGPGVPELTLVGGQPSTGQPSSKSMRRSIGEVAIGVGPGTVNHLARLVSTMTVRVDYVPWIWSKGPPPVFTTDRPAGPFTQVVT